MNNTTVAGNSIPDQVLDDIVQAIISKDYGSVEIYIESGRVVQITERTIKKTDRVNNGPTPNVRLYGKNTGLR